MFPLSSFPFTHYNSHSITIFLKQQFYILFAAKDWNREKKYWKIVHTASADSVIN